MERWGVYVAEGETIFKKFLNRFLLVTIGIFVIANFVEVRRSEPSRILMFFLVVEVGLGLLATALIAYVSGKISKAQNEAYEDSAYAAYKRIWEERTGNAGMWGVITAVGIAAVTLLLLWLFLTPL